MAKYPALFLALALGCGIVCAHLLHMPLWAAGSAFGVATVCALGFFFLPHISFRSHLVHVALLLAVCAGGMLRTTLAEMPLNHEVSFYADDTRDLLLLGQLREAPEHTRTSWRARVNAQALCVSESLCVRVNGTVLASGHALQRKLPGAHVILRGRLRLADAARNPGAFDYRAYLRANNIAALFYISDSACEWSRAAQPQWVWALRSAKLRTWLEEQIAAFARGQSRALLKGLVLGQIDELDPAIMESFARTGLIHILSVSGLHVGFIILILIIAANLLRVPQRGQWPLVLALVWCYAELTGMRAPIVRAAVMASVAFAGRAFERETNLPNNLGVSALLILAWQPLQLFQLGFQLSFLAMLGLAFLYPPLAYWGARISPWRWPPWHWAMQLIAASLAAQLATLPVIVWNYGRVPVTALWGNLVVIPLSFIAVATAALACASAPLAEFAMQAYGAVAELTANSMITFTHWLATLPWAYIEGVTLPPLLLLAYVVLLAVALTLRKPIRARLLLLALFLANLHVWHALLYERPTLRVTFFDVGQGDAALLAFPQQRYLLIDTGPQLENTSAGERVLLPYLHRQGITRLHGVVISHAHADHLGGLPALLLGVRIDSVYFAAPFTATELEQRCRRLMDSLKVPHRVLHAGERLLAFQPAGVTVLCSAPTLRKRLAKMNLNETSIVLKIVFGRNAMLFAGDIEQPNEEHLLAHANALPSELLKVPHHGSRTSSTERFLRAVSPRYAVISVGRSNRFEHPHSEVLSRCQNLGIPTLRTDLAGAIIFATDGTHLVRLK